MEAYSVWASLNLKGNALEQMGKFLAITKEVNSAITLLSKNLSLVDDKLITASTSLKGLSSGFALLKTESATSLSGFQGSLSRTTTKVSKLTEQTQLLSASMVALKAKSESAAFTTGIGAGAGAVSARSRRHYGMHGLSEMGMGEVAKPASALIGASMFGGPIAMGAAGVGILAYKGFESQKDYQMKLAQISSLGLGDDYTSKLNSIAQNTNITGISKNRMIEAVVDAQMATRAGPGQIHEIEMMAPALAKGALQSELIFGHGMTDAQQKDLVRFAEIQGGSSPEKQLEWLRAGINMMITSGGTVDPAKQLKFAQATSGAIHWTPEAYLANEPILQELQSRTGTALTSGSRALVGGMSMAGFNKKSIAFWEKIGLLKNGEMSQQSKYLYETDTPAFVEKVLMPMLSAKGYKSDEKITEAFNMLPRTPQMYAKTAYKNMTKIQRARAMSHSVLTSDELDEIIKKTPAFAVSRLSSSWENFSLAFGKFSSPASILAINAVSRALESLTIIMKALSHPLAYGSQAINAVRQNFDKNIQNLDGLNVSKYGLMQGGLKENMGSPYRKTSGEQQSGSVHLDGKKVGNVLFPHFANAMNRSGTTASTGAFNSSLSMAPVGLSNYGNQQ